MRIECLHADTCLPDYWGGHHLPHVCIPVWAGMSLAEIKEQLKNEVWQGAIAGNIPVKLTEDDYSLNEKGYNAYIAAIDCIEGCNGKTEGFFSDLEEPEDEEDCDLVFAYFVFMEV